MNEKDLINFIRIANPIGEYFEELGGIFVREYEYENILYVNPKVLLFITNQCYWPKLTRISDDKYIFTGPYLKRELEFTTISGFFDYEFYEIPMKNSLKYYYIPRCFELDYINDLPEFKLIPLTYKISTIEFFNSPQHVPLVRRIIIE